MRDPEPTLQPTTVLAPEQPRHTISSTVQSADRFDADAQKERARSRCHGPALGRRDASEEEEERISEGKRRVGHRREARRSRFQASARRTTSEERAQKRRRSEASHRARPRRPEQRSRTEREADVEELGARGSNREPERPAKIEGVVSLETAEEPRGGRSWKPRSSRPERGRERERDREPERVEAAAVESKERQSSRRNEARRT